MHNAETQATMGTQDIGQRQNTKHTHKDRKLKR
jgi:hypothetical protein